MGTFANWETSVLTAISAPVTKENISFLDSWANAEGGSAAYNPLNTTQPEPGATNYNSVGVKIFTDAQSGVTATATTLENGLYPDLLAALRSGNPLAHITDAVKAQLNTWGTGSSFLANAGSASAPTSQPIIGPGGIIDTSPSNPLEFQVGSFDLGQWAQANRALLIGIGMLILGAVIILSNHESEITEAVK